MVNTRWKFARERTSNEDREVVRYRCSVGSDKLHTHTRSGAHEKKILYRCPVLFAIRV